MIRKLTTSFKNQGASSYFTVTFTPESNLINYQLEMLVANDISHVLPVSKLMENGELVAYYNITSKVSLSTILGRNKLNKKQVIELIEGAVKAIRDAGEYQLPENGLVMEPEFIFVDPSKCTPEFVYLPLMNTGTKSLKELIIDLIINGNIETSSDNFIQVLLETLNSTPLSLTKLESCLAAYKEKKNVELTQRKPVSEPVNPKPVIVPEPKPVTVSDPIPPVHEVEPTPGPKTETKPEENPSGKKPKPPKDKKTNKKVKEQKVKIDKNDSDDDFDAEAAKKKFLLPQAAIMVALAAAYSFGIFFDENGALAMTNIAAVLGCVVLIEFVLYREAYVNAKAPKANKKKEKKEAVQKGKKPAIPKKDVSFPGKAPSEVKPPISNTVNERPPVVNLQPMAPVEPSKGEPMGVLPRPEYKQPKNIVIPANWGETEFSDETVVWDGEQNVAAAHLEYFENGIITRIPLDKSSVLVGRLSGQVDFAIPNPKVGKVHAEFVCQNGQFYVKDLSSKNGTYINGSTTRINSNTLYPISDNDKIKLADSELLFKCS